MKFTIIKECSVSKARTSIMELPHYEVELPMFMPVGTQGTMKGLTTEQVKDTGAQIILGNTYHLGTRPGSEVMTDLQGLHSFMQWDRALLTDSGGFQMVSLLKLAEITEEGVQFQSPYDGSLCLLTPEESITIQRAIGADIMMQLDDVVDVMCTDFDRFSVSVDRTTRWLDRCIAAAKSDDANASSSEQSLFAIVQGGTDEDLRERSLSQLIARDSPGYAIGGLSGGESKSAFCKTVLTCTRRLPRTKPRYCMGVGMAVDIVVSCALGVDMFDCVYPTRTARFGCALIEGGQINLKSAQFRYDFGPLESGCDCATCSHYTRAAIRAAVAARDTIACHLISVHNITHMMRLMGAIRESIKLGRFPTFVNEFMNSYYKDGDFPTWVVDALTSVNIELRKINEDDCDEDGLWDDHENSSAYLERVSGFCRTAYNSGLREVVRGEEENTEEGGEDQEKGRLVGFEAAFRVMKRNNGKDLNGREKTAITISRFLSTWKGVLLALRTLKGDQLTKEEVTEVEDAVSEAERLLQQRATPDDDKVTAIVNGKPLEEDEKIESAAVRWGQLCRRFKWKIPDWL